MSDLYNAAVAATTYHPTLTGVAGPTAFAPDAKSFDGSSFDAAPSQTTLSFGDSAWVNLWAKPTSTSGDAVLFETGGITHGFALHRSGTSAVLVMARNTTQLILTVPSAFTAGQWTNIHAYTLALSAGLAKNGEAATTGVAPAYVSNGSDDGGIGGIGGLNGLGPSGATVFSPGNRWVGDMGALRIGITDGSAYGPALYAGPTPINTVAPTLDTDGDWSVGSWDSQGNGSLTYTVLLVDDDTEETVATLQTASATTSGNCLAELQAAGSGNYRIDVTASNNGGSTEASSSAILFFNSPPGYVFTPPTTYPLAQPIWRPIWRL